MYLPCKRVRSHASLLPACQCGPWVNWVHSSTTLTQTAADIGTEYGVETLRVIGDLTIPEDVARIVHETVERFGHIDILVHNAGGNIRAGGAGGHPDPDDAIDISVEDVEAVLGSNLTSTILICKAVATGMFLDPNLNPRNGCQVGRSPDFYKLTLFLLDYHP